MATVKSGNGKGGGLSAAYRSVARVRRGGERRLMPYDPSRHPGLIRRMALIGCSDEAIAAVVGITLDTLNDWFAQHPELDESRLEMRMQEGHLLEAMHMAALGAWNDEEQRYEGGDVAAMKWLLETRHGYMREVERRRLAVDGKAAGSTVGELPSGELVERIESAYKAAGGDRAIKKLQ